MDVTVLPHKKVHIAIAYGTHIMCFIKRAFGNLLIVRETDSRLGFPPGSRHQRIHRKIVCWNVADGG